MIFRLKYNRGYMRCITSLHIESFTISDDIRRALAEAGAGSILIDLLSSPVDDIQSRASIILSDVCCVGENQTEIARLGAIPPLVSLYSGFVSVFSSFILHISQFAAHRLIALHQTMAAPRVSR